MNPRRVVQRVVVSGVVLAVAATNAWAQTSSRRAVQSTADRAESKPTTHRVTLGHAYARPKADTVTEQPRAASAHAPAEAPSHAESPAPDQHAAEGGAAHWSYLGATGPEHWGSLSADWETCSSGKAQSPIDLAPGSLLGSTLEFHYEPVALHIINNGHTVQVEYDPGSYIIADGERFELVQFHFHDPSEHAIGGERAAMEAHLVHRSLSGELAVVGIMIEGSGPENPAYVPVFHHLPAKVGERETPWAKVDASGFLPESKEYYRYRGSLTTPPCTEGVRWYVMKEPVAIADHEIEAFRALHPENARPLQPLNGRSLGKR